MKKNNSFKKQAQAKRLRVAAVVFGLAMFTGFQALAYTPCFKLILSGSKNVPKIEVVNESRDPIIRIELTVGDFDYHFDASSRKDTAKYNVNIGEGQSFHTNLDIDKDPDNNSVEDYRRVMFNNGQNRPNSTLTVVTLQGGKEVTESVTLTDGAADEEEYIFYSDSRPYILDIASISEMTDSSPEYVSRCTIRVNGEVGRDVNGSETRNIGSKVSLRVYKGDAVEISAPQSVYNDASGNYLTDSSKDEPDAIRDSAMERYEAIGISVNDTPQTGDPTLYRYTVEGDAEVAVKWRHDYALRVESDFAQTQSLLKDGGGNPWAGPLESEAVGNPLPEVKMHWIEKGETVIAQINGQVIDNSYPGLNIRYVPEGYEATGSAGSDRNFTVGQAPPARQQVSEFAMTGAGSIRYKWRIQYGVAVNADTLEHSPLPVIRQKISGTYQTVVSGEGVFWFDPGSYLQVLCAANENTASSLGLSGWMNGDGYYFGTDGDVNSADGSLMDEDEALLNATWIDSVQAVDSEGKLREFRGIQISGSGLQRPARVMWRYGNQAIAVTVPIGEYVFQTPETIGSRTYSGATFLTEPEAIVKIAVSGSNQDVTDMFAWDDVAAKLYPVVPGTSRVTWPSPDEDGIDLDVLVTAVYPDREHYPHISGAPSVNLDPNPDDSFIFKSIQYTENEASVNSESWFDAEQLGSTVLLFSEIDSSGRGEPREYLRVRVVKTRDWNDSDVLNPDQTAIIGKRIEDDLDLANLNTGWLLFPNARYNPFIYDVSRWEGLNAQSIYDMDALESTAQEKIVDHPENLAGPIIPVNLHPNAGAEEKIVIAWYDDPAMNDGILWPYATRVYNPRWPVDATEGLGRIVIASQYGSESIDNNLEDQVVVGAITNIVSDGNGGTTQNVVAAETTYNPTRVQQPIVYVQANIDNPGYNPNEEHALMAPSLRFAQVSPRPPAVYALRNNDLNRYNPSSSTEAGQPENYTSHPYVLSQFYDAAAKEFKMRVYSVKATVPEIEGYTFANSDLWDGSAPSARRLHNEPNVVMEAGEPVIPFYPLGVVIGAVPPPEAYGFNITGQLTYWEDHKNTSWSVSGGSNAWFSVYPFYPRSSDFWWDSEKVGRVQVDEDGNKTAQIPNIGDSLAFLPQNINGFMSLPDGALVSSDAEQKNEPTQILYKSDWPDVAPVLKAGETLTFSGGEYRQDHPTTLTVNEDGDLETVETPGLPQVLAFATAEVVYDSLNPKREDDKWVTDWTARIGQVLEKRSVRLTVDDFPDSLSPSSGRVRIKQGKYVFSELPASLQKRVRYDAINAKLEIFGLVNDKDIGEDTLTASPPQVYVLEPNILTDEDVKALKDLDEASAWHAAIDALQKLTQNPTELDVSGVDYLVGLEPKIVRDEVTGEPKYIDQFQVPPVYERLSDTPAPFRAFGPGLALLPNADFLDPSADVPEVSWITVVENNDPSLGGSPVTPHVIKVDRRERYRGAIKTVLSDNVFDENIVLRHQGDFGAHADKLVFEWYYRPDDGSLNVLPPDLIEAGKPNPWKIFPDLSGKQGAGRYEIMLKGNPNAPEALLADTWWFCRYRHENDVVEDTDWGEGDDRVNYTWAGAGNSDPFNDFDLNGYPDFKAQLAMGWIKRVLDAVNPYEARIRDFEGDNPSTKSSMLAQFGARYEGPVALNPDKDVIENVGLIALYQTILNRGKALSIDLSRPVSTPAIANALQLASTRISDFYTILGNEAYSDAQDPTIGIGSDTIDYGALGHPVFTFQNQLSTPLEEELALLRGMDDGFARPVYNRIFWNFTKGEGEAAYAMNYNISDINADGFIDEDDAMILYPQGHGDAWGHYLTAVRMQYDLFRHRYFNWVSRSEFYNLMDIVMKVDFLDERKFAQMAAAKAKAGAQIVNQTYREKFVLEPSAQWQGYRDSNPDRAWGVEGWARRAGQGAYFDWVTANAILPSEHPNGDLEGVQKVDRQTVKDIYVVSANMNSIQTTFDQANNGYNPLGLSSDAVVFDVDPTLIEVGSGQQGNMHFNQIYDRAMAAYDNVKSIWEHANESQNRVRQIANSETEFRNDVYQEDLSYKNQLIEIFGRPYEGTIGSGKLYPAGYDGPDLALHMYVDVREINDDTVPGPTESFAKFSSSGSLSGGDLYDAFNKNDYGQRALTLNDDWRNLFAPTFAGTDSAAEAKDGLFTASYTDLDEPRVALDGFTTLMPVTTAGYTFQAPDSWGNRLAVGQLQSLLNEMLQQEASVAEAIAAWDGLTGELIRTIRIVDARIKTYETIDGRNADFARTQYIFNTVETAVNATLLALDTAKEIAQSAIDAAEEMIPTDLPTGGLAVSPGDAVAPARGAVGLVKLVNSGAFGAITTGLEIGFMVKEAAFEVAGTELDLANTSAERKLEHREWLKEIEDIVGDEAILRVSAFKEIEALRGLSDQYRALLDQGVRLIDERTAFNKRVAAATQMNRYQDMTFRVSRNHALQSYRSAFDLAARYAYLAAKTYDYETCFDPSHPGYPGGTMGAIIKGNIGGSLSWLKTNYDSVSGQLGINNPQIETGEMSLRTEKFRIYPKGETQSGINPEAPNAGESSDDVWKRQLKSMWVDNLWDVSEFRRHCRVFDVNPEDGNEPGLVIRFSTDIKAGENVFGRMLSGGDHAYSTTLYATKIRALGVWFSDYQSEDMDEDLSATPRVYLVPVGTDIQSTSSSSDPTQARYWNVVDQRIPVPLPATGSELDRSDWMPLYDSLNGQYGEHRMFSDFLASHDGGGDLVYNSRLIGRSVRNTQWVLIIPGRTLNADPTEGLDRFIDQVSDIKLVFETYGYSGN